MDKDIIGYLATTASVIGYGSQFIHTIRNKSVSGLSLNRTIMDSFSLLLWVAYSVRLEDIPLLTATSCELFVSLFVCVLILRQKKTQRIYDAKTISSESFNSNDCVIDIPERRNSI
jgi:hypothetical protein